MLIRYEGPHEAVDIPALGVQVLKGGTFEATGDIAKSLLEQGSFVRSDKAGSTTEKEN